MYTLCVLQYRVQATYGRSHNGTMYGRGVGHQLTINLQPNEFITHAVVGFANMTSNNKTVVGLCSLQFTVNEGAVPGFNADANCSSQAYTRVSLGSSLAYLEPFQNPVKLLRALGRQACVIDVIAVS
jgi:hypothetical protein